MSELILDYAQKLMLFTPDLWLQNVDRLMKFNESLLLQNVGSVSSAKMKTIPEKGYGTFDAAHRSTETVFSDAEDINMIEPIKLQAKRKGDRK
jgi:hypothetical protein